MKITLYTVNDCQFSKQEKDYLTSKGLKFDEKNLETNREWLTEMLAISNNFAGTPVTKIEKDNGQSVVLKGFTKEEFDKELAVGAASAMPAMHMSDTSTQDSPAPSAPTPPPVQEPSMPPAPEPVPPMPEPTPSAPEAPATPPVEEPVQAPTQQTAPMSAMAPEPPAQEPVVPPTPPTPQPTPPPVVEPPQPTMPTPVEPPAQVNNETTSAALSSILEQLQSKSDANPSQSSLPPHAYN